MKLTIFFWSILFTFNINPKHHLVDKASKVDFETEMIQKINNYRFSKGLHALKIDSILTKSAILVAKCNSESNKLSHSCNGSFCKRTKEINYIGAENLTTYSTVNEAFNAWVNSPTHNTNMLRKEDLYIGIAFVEGSKQDVWAMIAGTPNCEDCTINCK